MQMILEKQQETGWIDRTGKTFIQNTELTSLLTNLTILLLFWHRNSARRALSLSVSHSLGGRAVRLRRTKVSSGAQWCCNEARHRWVKFDLVKCTQRKKRGPNTELCGASQLDDKLPMLTKKLISKIYEWSIWNQQLIKNVQIYWVKCCGHVWKKAAMLQCSNRFISVC